MSITSTAPGDRVEAVVSATHDHRGEARPSPRDLVLRTVLRGAMRAYLILLAAVRRLGPRPVPAARHRVLLTLNFHAAGWPKALLTPLTLASRCERVSIVTTAVVEDLEHVEVIRPPKWLQSLCGSTVARLCTFAVVALRRRPTVVGGVHLLFNGLVAALIARLAGARALYICVGGPNEVAGGGLWSENRAFGLLRRPDAVLEQCLVDAARSFDTIVTMGTRAAAFFRSHGAQHCLAIPSGVDGSMYRPGTRERDVDVILVARLVPLKRIDLFVRTIHDASKRHPTIKAVLIGRGPMLEPAQELARQLGVANHIQFLGHEPDVSNWFRRAKVFLLTSDTEGVSISLIEAMLSGAVPVVSDVGDLGDVVESGLNGFLVAERTSGAFARAVINVLADETGRQQLSLAARATARRFDPAALSARWDRALVGDAFSNTDTAVTQHG